MHMQAAGTEQKTLNNKIVSPELIYDLYRKNEKGKKNQTKRADCVPSTTTSSLGIIQ